MKKYIYMCKKNETRGGILGKSEVISFVAF